MKSDGRVSDTFDVSIDGMLGDEEGKTTDRMPELGIDPEVTKVDKRKEQPNLEKLYKIIEERFPIKKATIFYRLFGINGHKKETARTIASELGVSEIRISQIKKDIVLYLKGHPKAMEILSELNSIYTESLLLELYHLGREQIYEALISDDMFMLLESMTRWDSKQRLKTSFAAALDNLETTEADYIVQCMQDGFDYIDSTYRKNKPIIVKFLSLMEPTDTFSRRSDAYILDKMSELQMMCQKHGLYN